MLYILQFTRCTTIQYTIIVHYTIHYFCTLYNNVLWYYLKNRNFFRIKQKWHKFLKMGLNLQKFGAFMCIPYKCEIVCNVTKRSNIVQERVETTQWNLYDLFFFVTSLVFLVLAFLCSKHIVCFISCFCMFYVMLIIGGSVPIWIHFCVYLIHILTLLDCIYLHYWVFLCCCVVPLGTLRFLVSEMIFLYGLCGFVLAIFTPIKVVSGGLQRWSTRVHRGGQWESKRLNII